MIEFKTVSIRKETYDYVDIYAYTHDISKAQALDDMVNYFKEQDRKGKVIKDEEN